jgi:hypothetical protein
VFYNQITNVKKNFIAVTSISRGSEVESEASNNEPGTTRADRVAAKNDLNVLWFVVTGEIVELRCVYE